jgi:hypothetical protein
MEKIEEALEKEITRGNCLTCSRKYYDKDRGFIGCGVTEEPIGSGNEYCAFTNI